jgi:hypothetical protein
MDLGYSACSLDVAFFFLLLDFSLDDDDDDDDDDNRDCGAH